MARRNDQAVRRVRGLHDGGSNMQRLGWWVATALLAGAACGSRPVWASGVDLTLGSEVTAQGCTKAVPLTMSGGDGGVGGVEIDMLFPQAVFSLIDTNNPCTLQPGLPGQVSAALVADPPAPPGMQRLRIVVLDMQNGVYPDGTLASCTLKVAPAAAVGAYQVQIGTDEPPTVADVQGSELPWGVWTNSTITVNAASGCCP